jgi:creatinine amidohydrolase
MAKAILFGQLTSSEVAKLVRSRRKPVVILPMGATEAHGEHLPVWTDAITPYELAKRVSERTGALVLPPLNYGFCYTLRPWAGTLSLKSATFASCIRDITRELVRNGFGRILYLNGHGANATIAGHVLKELADEFSGAPVHGGKESNKQSGSCPSFCACIVSWWEMRELEGICGGSAGHADENEASIVMALTGWKRRLAKQARTQRYFGRVIPMPSDQFTSFGYAGKVGGESAARGRKMEKAIVEKLVKLVEADLLLKEK